MLVDRQTNPASYVWPGWILLAATLVSASAALRLSSSAFGHDAEIIDMPIAALVVAYCAIGIVSVIALPKLIQSSSAKDLKRLLVFIVLAGAAMRLVQFGAEPVLEDDYNRYLWDGAVTAQGGNPYAKSPQGIADATPGGSQISELRTQAGQVFERINYPEFRTVYPPVAQAAFALAHEIAPFNLNAWRAVLLIVELASLALMIAILRKLGRSPLWSSLYWWNPLIIKEFANSAHMEPLVILPVTLAVYLVLNSKPVIATGVLAIAAGAKIWPILLTSPVLRQLLSRPVWLVIACLLAAGIIAVLAWPIVAAGLGEDSGFVAYAQKWRASSAAYLVSAWLASNVIPQAVSHSLTVGLAARLVLALALVVAIVITVSKPCSRVEVVAQRMFWIAAALYVLSPSQFPWYFGWIAPFLCIYPVRGLLLASALLPLHYLYFHLDARDLKHLYTNGIVWLMWLPVWGMLALDVLRARRVTAET